MTDTTNENSFKIEYLKADYLENYVNRANTVIRYLQKQAWINKGKLVIFGHSQGSKIAPRIASTNRKVTHLGLSGANPFGRIDAMIRKERKHADAGTISWETAEKNMDNWYHFWELANDPGYVKDHPEMIPWKSFSEPVFNDLLKINIPIYLTYGTKDIGSDLCDLIPLFFIRHRKINLTLKRHIGLKHNYFEVEENGNPIYSNGHWVDWTLK